MTNPAQKKTAPPAPKPFEVRNPRYAGATPEDVARSLFRPIQPKTRETKR